MHYVLIIIILKVIKIQGFHKTLLRMLIILFVPSQVTFGVFGYPEFIVSEPISPKEIVRVVYEKCMPFDPVEAVLQQEVKFLKCTEGL